MLRWIEEIPFSETRNYVQRVLENTVVYDLMNPNRAGMPSNRISYYLGQSLMKLGQAGQACKAYSELEEVYGTSMRAELKRLLPTAKSEAACN